MAFSTATVMIWSSCFEPVPPIFMEPGGRGLHGIDVLFRGLVRLVGIHPEHELVERQHRDRREILPVERNAGRERGGEEVGERDDDLVRISARSLEVEEAFAAGAARLVDDDHRLLHQIVLGDDALDRARHLVGAAAGAGRNDELDGAHRLPCRGRRSRNPDRAQAPQSRPTPFVQCASFDSLPSICGCAGLVLSPDPTFRVVFRCRGGCLLRTIMQAGIVRGARRRGIRSFRPIVEFAIRSKGKSWDARHVPFADRARLSLQLQGRPPTRPYLFMPYERWMHLCMRYARTQTHYCCRPAFGLICRRCR